MLIRHSISMKPLLLRNLSHFRFYMRKPLIDKVLIANRGEIALRILRTLKALGIKTVCVYSDFDKSSNFVQHSDESYHIGQNPASESYLNMEKIIEVAKKTNCKGIHPGYGFLSENSKFASLVQQNGMVFIGPPPKAIIDMGSKSMSKIIMKKAGVKVVPGYHGEDQSLKTLKQKANEISYPILIKAVLGGGGKGMRIVYNENEFEEKLNSAKREALKSFNNDNVLLEKYIEISRHIELQVFGDNHGNYVHLYERDCSIQRRHQKIIEEAPAISVDIQTRKKLGEMAIKAAKAVDYRGAGTVEFIMDVSTNEFYFMEMNTRLQVEHPITEMITGIDLVKWQIEIASDNKLPKSQEEIDCIGHAIEARIYAENPKNNFLPDTGIIKYLKTPITSQNVRLESAIFEKDEVSIHYDPMISKLITFGNTRIEAITKMEECLNNYHLVGLNTNIDFIRRIIENKEFRKNKIDTDFIKKHHKDLFEDEEICMKSIVSIALIEMLNKTNNILNNIWSSHVPFIPNILENTRKFILCHNDKDLIVTVKEISDNTFEFIINYNDKDYKEVVTLLPNSQTNTNEITFQSNGQIIRRTVFKENTTYTIFAKNKDKLIINKKSLTIHKVENQQNNIYSPMPCKISKILVTQNMEVKKDDPIIVLEAMKMEHTIKAISDCTIEKIMVSENEVVGEKKLLVQLMNN